VQRWSLVACAVFRCVLVVQWLCLNWTDSVYIVPARDERQTVGGSGAVIQRAADLMPSLLQWSVQSHGRTMIAGPRLIFAVYCFCCHWMQANQSQMSEEVRQLSELCVVPGHRNRSGQPAAAGLVICSGLQIRQIYFSKGWVKCCEPVQITDFGTFILKQHLVA